MTESTGTTTGRSTGKRWLIGCGLGCGLLIVMVIAAIVAFGVWIGGESELLEPQKLRGADTTGYLEWTLNLEDEGTAGFSEALIEALQSLSNEGADEMRAEAVAVFEQHNLLASAFVKFGFEGSVGL